MENATNNLSEQEEQNESTAGNNNVSPNDDGLGENTELTPVGKELEEDEENDAKNSVNDGKPATDPAPDDDAQLDVETVSP